MSDNLPEEHDFGLFFRALTQRGYDGEDNATTIHDRAVFEREFREGLAIATGKIPVPFDPADYCP